MKNIIKTGIGEEGEFLWLEKSEQGFQVHAQNNTESPFKFERLEDAEAFMNLLSKFRMSSRIEEMLSNE